jgi:hypothetical protein
MIVAGAILFGCGYTHDPATYFAQGWTSEYQQVRGCEKSEDHTGPYNKVYLNQSSVAQFHKETRPLPEGTVFLKPQYSDSECRDLKVWTVMRKGRKDEFPASNDWDWQTVFDSGHVAQQGQSKFCIGCHENCDDFICTDP